MAPELPVPLAPPITTGFVALRDNNLSIPPDTHGAVGPTKVMTVLNTEVNVQLHDGTQVGGYPITLNAFWAGLATAGTFDPRVKFDPDPAYGGRWIWVSVQDSHAVGSGTLVAVSDVSGGADGKEPNRGFGVLIDADPRVALPFYWADYPTVGFNKNWVVVQVNMFDEGTSTFDRTKIYVFDKAKLYADPGTTGPCMPPPTATGCTLIESTSIGATHVPAAMYDFAVDEMYLLNRWNSGAGVLGLFKIDGSIGIETLTTVGFPMSPVPWQNSSPGRLDFAPESETGSGCNQCARARVCSRRTTRESRTWSIETARSGPRRPSSTRALAHPCVRRSSGGRSAPTPASSSGASSTTRPASASTPSRASP